MEPPQTVDIKFVADMARAGRLAAPGGNTNPTIKIEKTPSSKSIASTDRARPHSLAIDPPSRRNSESKNAAPVSKIKKWFRDNLLLFLTIIAVFVGVAVGMLLRLLEPHEDTIEIISMPGQILTRLLKMLILPLLVSSLISGLSQQNASTSSKMGLLALMYYSATTFLAAVLGITLVLTIHPGNPEHALKRQGGNMLADTRVSTRDSILDLLRNFFPENLVQSCFEQQKTVYKLRKKKLGTTLPPPTPPPPRFSNPYKPEVNTSTGWEEAATATTTAVPAIDLNEYKRVVEYTAGTNVLGLIAFCICFGICISHMGNRRAHVIIEFFFELNEAVMKLISIIMWYSPIGIFFLIVSNVASITSLGELMTQLGMYMVTVIAGLAIHGFLSLPCLYFIFTRKNPYLLVRGVLQAVITALGTSSSAATLPITFRCLEMNLGIDSRVARFVLPIGATVNMDGTALYEAVAPIFIAQMRNRPLSFYQIVVVSLTATLASIGAAAIPSAGLVTMVIVLTSIGLPTDDIYLIWAVDWLLDRCRTSINVLGDCYGTAIVAHLSAPDLERQDIEFAQQTEKEAEDNLRQIQRQLSMNVVDIKSPEPETVAPMAAPVTQLRKKANAGMLYRRTSFIRDYSTSIRLKATLSVDPLAAGKPTQANSFSKREPPKHQSSIQSSSKNPDWV